MTIFELKTILSCLIFLIFNGQWARLRITFCLWVLFSGLNSVNAVLREPKENRRLHLRVMFFTLIETSLLLFFIFLIEPDMDTQIIYYTSPLRPTKEVFSFIYLCVFILRSMFKGIVVYTKA